MREIQHLYQDGIAAAEKSIYIENQYLTSGDIAGLLVEKLRQENGPEIVVVLPCNANGWLEKSTMDAIRNKIVTRLQEADRHTAWQSSTRRSMTTVSRFMSTRKSSSRTIS